MAQGISAFCIVLFIIITAAGVEAQSLSRSPANGDPTAITSSEDNIEILGLDSSAFPKIKVNLFINKFCALSGNLKLENFKVKEDANDIAIDNFYFMGNASGHKLDLAIVFDTSGSMGNEIKALQLKVQDLISKINSSKLDAKYSLITFKADVEATKVNWTSNSNYLINAIGKLSASGGDSGPENSLGGIETVLSFGFRPDAQKVILVITDEPSHQKGDGYRNSTYTVEGANKNLSTSGVILIAVSPDFGNPSVDPGVPRSDLTKYVDMRVIANEIGLWIDINSADFSTILDQFKGILTGTYVIEYTSPDQMPGKNRTALVSVDAPGCVAGSDSSAYVSSGSKDNLNSPPAIESMTSDKASPQDAGTAINWTANAVDPDDDLILYKFLLDGRPMTPWAEDKTWIWMPGQAGHYRVEVQVRDAKHAGPNAQDDRMEESFTINERKPATSENQPPIVNDLLAMQSKAKEITWTANATDSDGDRILYRYFLNNKSMTDWIDRNKWILNATEANAGENQVEVQIRDGVHADPNGYDDAKSVKFNLSSMKLMTQTWEKKLAGSGASVKQTEDGGYIVAGGGDGGWLIKTDSYGNTLWEVNYGGGQCEHVEQTNDGGYIVAGLNVSSDGKDTDVWLIKTDKNGNLIWDNTFGGSQTEYGLFVQQTNDGGYLIAGECTSYSGDFDAWVIKTDSEGNAEWDKTYGKTSAKSALQTDDGEYIIIGYTIYSDPDNAWIIKANLKGEEQWHRELSGDTVQSGTKTNDDGYIVAGGFYSDAWLTKTDENGNEKWHKTLSRTTAHFAQQTKDGGYIVAGGDYPSSAWLIKTDANGNEEWQRTLDEVHKTHGANSVAQTKDGGYIVVAEGWLFKTDANGNV